MKVVIEARSISATPSGVRTYVDELIRHILQLVDLHDISLLYDSDTSLGTFPEVDEIVVPRHGDKDFYRWLHRKVPVALDGLLPDVVHFTKADIPKRLEIPTVVTIFDTIPLRFPESQSWTRRLYWPRALRRSAKVADHIITISDSSRDDIIDFLHISPDKITVIPLPVDISRFQPVDDSEMLESVREKYALPENFLLFVGTRDNRKNIGALVRAFGLIKDDISYDLVIAGKPALKRDGSQLIAKELDLEDRVHFPGIIDAIDLPSLYSAADLFVFPSVYEGWCFPALEAMACGTPVIVSNGAPLPQVVAEAGEVVEFSTDVLLDRLDDKVFVEKLAEKIAIILKDRDKQKSMISKGLIRAAELSWEEVAKETLDVYKKVL